MPSRISLSNCLVFGPNFWTFTKGDLLFGAPSSVRLKWFTAPNLKFESRLAPNQAELHSINPFVEGPLSMKIQSLLRSAIAAAFVCSPSLLMAQTGNQGFKVVVQPSLSITAPAAISLTHDQTDNPQAFPDQAWVVRGNVRNGVTVTFATAAPFVHSEDNTFKRNAKLDLAVDSTQGPATWQVDTATDTTNFAANDNVAQVAASSNGVGRANLNLKVTFVTEDFSLFAAGDYVTTVTGTIAAKN